MILDYSNFIESEDSYFYGHTHQKGDIPSFWNLGICPFCDIKANIVANEVFDYRVSPLDSHGTINTAWSCTCGWWQIKSHDWRNDSGYELDSHLYRNAIIKRYDDNDIDLPLGILRNALLKRPDILQQTSSKKMEDLVGSVFRDYFNCKAYTVGKSGDKGIDLVLIDGEITTFVQVKHRDVGSKRWRAEPVSPVVEFMGATLLSQGKHAIFVSTANRFTRGAHAMANRAVELGFLAKYELVDSPRFLTMLNLIQEKETDHWRHNLDRLTRRN